MLCFLCLCHTADVTAATVALTPPLCFLPDNSHAPYSGVDRTAHRKRSSASETVCTLTGGPLFLFGVVFGICRFGPPKLPHHLNYRLVRTGIRGGLPGGKRPAAMPV